MTQALDQTPTISDECYLLSWCT